MKKTFSFMAVFCLAAVANATILRVSNVEGSSAPYSSIGDALSAAAEGDTIMVDASPIAYDFIEIGKRVVLLGPGHSLVKNGIISEGAESATINGIKIDAEGTVVRGITIPGGKDITIKAHKVVINRCFVHGSINLRGASNSIIHQNFVGNVEGYGSESQESYLQVTNNILYGRVSCLHNSYIAYNTGDGFFIYGCKDCTIEKNWSNRDISKGSLVTGSSFDDNYVSETYTAALNNSSRYDGSVAAVEVDETLRSTYGAFAGDDPYVLSGVPAGPVIQDLIVPASVEKGSKLQVTIKVGIQQ